MATTVRFEAGRGHPGCSRAVGQPHGVCLNGTKQEVEKSQQQAEFPHDWSLNVRTV